MAEETVPVAARLPMGLVAKLDELAPAMGGTRSDVLRALIEEYAPIAPVDADAPLFAPPLPAPPRARATSFADTRYDRVGNTRR